MDNATAQLADYDVYTGIWINNLRGRVYGATITLDHRNGGILIAFLALYVGLAGQGFWRIMRFLLHHSYSSSYTPNGVYNQLQAVLRNSDSAHTAAWDLVLIGWAWRKKKVRRLYGKLFPVIVLSMVVSLSFTAAGIMSSRVTSNDANEVLLTGKNCGKTIIGSTKNEGYYIPPTIPFNRILHAMKNIEYLTYALQCYRNNGSASSEKCQTYVMPNLPYTMDVNAPCPFTEELCALQTGNIAFDTGYLSSDKHLGINSKLKFEIRQTRQCAPLATKGFTRLEGNSTQQYMRYYYNVERNDTSTQPRKHLTFQVEVPSNRTATIIKNFQNRGLQDIARYKLSLQWYYDADDVTIIPLPQRSQPDSQISLILLDASGIIYSSSVTDPWFSATQPIRLFGPQPPGPHNESSFFLADNPVSTIACATKLYVCNPSLPSSARCITPYTYTGIPTISPSAFTSQLSMLWPNPRDAAAVFGALRFIPSRDVFTADDFYIDSGWVPSLISAFSLEEEVQMDALPPTRWHAELEYTFQAALAALQARMVENAIGTIWWTGNDDAACAPREACRNMCQAQMMRSPRHYSFSALGVFLILGLGALLIGVGYGVEWIAGGMASLRRVATRKQSVTSHTRYAQLEWDATSTLQLQRLAHEGRGLGVWSGAAAMIPVTRKDDVLGVLEESDGRHTLLVHPTALADEKLALSAETERGESESGGVSDHDSFLSRVRIESGAFGASALDLGSGGGAGYETVRGGERGV